MVDKKKEKVLISIGKISKSFGYSGQLKLIFHKNLKSLPKIKGTIWLKINQKMVPFFINEADYIDDLSAILSLDDITSPDLAARLNGYEVYYPVLISKANALEEQGLQILIGFDIFNQEQKKLGKISEITERFGQALFTITHETHEILVPFHEDLLIEFDPVKQFIVLNIAEGLEDL